VAGLETSLPLMLTAVQQGRLSLDRLVELMALNPRRIFGLPTQPDTIVEIDPEARTTLANDRLLTRCGWTPFAGMGVQGVVRRVTLRGRVVFDVDRPEAMAPPGAGRLI
jgi:carbamoyl-phosphate synthase/aspartate carbamoyltransferase/dihydroorotase